MRNMQKWQKKKAASGDDVHGFKLCVTSWTNHNWIFARETAERVQGWSRRVHAPESQTQFVILVRGAKCSGRVTWPPCLLRSYMHPDTCTEHTFVRYFLASTSPISSALIQRPCLSSLYSAHHQGTGCFFQTCLKTVAWSWSPAGYIAGHFIFEKYYQCLISQQPEKKEAHLHHWWWRLCPRF